jgi:hypothetical protein
MCASYKDRYTSRNFTLILKEAFASVLTLYPTTNKLARLFALTAKIFQLVFTLTVRSTCRMEGSCLVIVPTVLPASIASGDDVFQWWSSNPL